MAMKYSRLSVFGGAILALAIMTVLSAFVGYAAVLIPRKYTYYLSTVLFVIFGLKLLKEGYYMSADEGQEELEEVSAELKKREESVCPFNAITFKHFINLFLTNILSLSYAYLIHGLLNLSR